MFCFCNLDQKRLDRSPFSTKCSSFLVMPMVRSARVLKRPLDNHLTNQLINLLIKITNRFHSRFSNIRQFILTNLQKSKFEIQWFAHLVGPTTSRTYLVDIREIAKKIILILLMLWMDIVCACDSKENFPV